MDNVWIAMVVFAFVGAVTPGPVNILATSTAVSRGLSAALMHVAGASIAYALVVYCSGSVLQSVLSRLPRLEFGLQCVGSVFLFYLAYKIYTAPVTAVGEAGATVSGFWTGSMTQFLNPKAWLYAASGVSLYVLGQTQQDVWLIHFTLVSLVVCLFGVGIWAVIGRMLSGYLENPFQQRTFNRGMAVLLGCSIGLIWL
ncbi:LysE family translocator [Vibrio sp. V39_P1S14PM300]|uniref:LysE family translocator n=1 Tax=Vibrio sp. V39_P1S14PM300 TaxID=1938690 RepID=UPI0013737206|nr:LysE family translocator [Vibrio sp. V39_P1S14PM300]NAX22562.1 LysE family transporter [Vibrio sp. V39_P1S14PM300]